MQSVTQIKCLPFLFHKNVIKFCQFVEHSVTFYAQYIMALDVCMRVPYNSTLRGGEAVIMGWMDGWTHGFVFAALLDEEP